MEDKSGYVYVLQMEGHPYYKIGRTENLTRRISQISPQMPGRLTLTFAYHVGRMCWAESTLHKEFNNQRLNGEWFQLDSACLQEIRTALLFCQAETLLKSLIDNFTYEAANDVLFNSRTEQYGNVLALAARRCTRRFDSIYKLRDLRILGVFLEAEDLTEDTTLDAEIVI